MSDVSYTHGIWRVKPGNEAAFIEAWKALGDLFRALPNPPGPGRGILIQNVADPLLFCTVGLWRSSEDLAAMRANPLNPVIVCQGPRAACDRVDVANQLVPRTPTGGIRTWSFIT